MGVLRKDSMMVPEESTSFIVNTWPLRLFAEHVNSTTQRALDTAHQRLDTLLTSITSDRARGLGVSNYAREYIDVLVDLRRLYRENDQISEAEYIEEVLREHGIVAHELNEAGQSWTYYPQVVQ